jgi:hypothetical protein
MSAMVAVLVFVALALAGYAIAYNGEFEIFTCIVLGTLLLFAGIVLTILVRATRSSSGTPNRQ